MPPKAQTNVLRGRGRPTKRSAAPEPAPVANALTRGRVAKADPVEASIEPSKKRGRPAKAPDEEPEAVAAVPKRGRRSLAAPEAPVEDTPAPKKRMGRPAKEEGTEAPAAVPTPKKRAGRPSKADAAVEETPTTPKPRGRPPKNAAAAIDLSRVAGSPRVEKSRSKPIPRATKSAVAPRRDPRVRSKLRTRLPPAVKAKEEIAPQPTKRRGRPPKATAAPVPSPKKAAGRKTTKAAVAKSIIARKRRGYTTLEVPDKFAAQVQHYLQELQDAETLPTPIGGDAEVEAEVQTGAGAEEEDYDMIVEEEVHITSATAGVGEEDALAVAEQAVDGEDFGGDTEADEDDIEADVQEEAIQDVVIQEDVEDEPTEVATEVDVEMSVLEVAQMEQQLNDANALAQEFVGNVENHDDNPTSFLGNDDTEAFVRDAESRSSAGVIFG